jgi:hypothetical protein
VSNVELRPTNGNVPAGPQNSSNNIMASPPTSPQVQASQIEIRRIETHPSPVAPAQTPADMKFRYTHNSPPGSNAKTVDQDLIHKAENLKETVDQ